jgi:predicted metal-dependent HD superfamily phosphohydrolase
MTTVSNLVQLTRLYQEPHRKYHDLAHIAQMFDMAKVARIQLTESQTLAIWYHDAVYRAGDGENEHKSAQLARKHLENVVDGKVLREVETIINDTQTHKASIELSRAVIDLDLSILGANPDSYQVYMRLIRKEYSMVPYNKYAASRSKMLEHFIRRAKRGRLYYVLGELLNEYAIENMKVELDVLKDRSNDLIDD